MPSLQQFLRRGIVEIGHHLDQPLGKGRVAHHVHHQVFVAAEMVPHPGKGPADPRHGAIAPLGEITHAFGHMLIARGIARVGQVTPPPGRPRS